MNRDISRRCFIGRGAAALVLRANTCMPCVSRDTPPNVLCIISDNLRDAVVGMVKYPQAISPNIARLVQRGVRYSHAYSNVPLCGSSRARLLSSRAPWTTGYYRYDQQHSNSRCSETLSPLWNIS